MQPTSLMEPSAPAINTTAPTLFSPIEGITTAQLNVRNGPGTNFESLGVLNQNDIIHVTGRDSSGAWAQIEFAGAPDGKGWAAVEFLKIDDADSLPIVGAAQQSTAAPTNVESTQTFPVAMQDGDSMQAPLGAIVFSPAGARSLQLNGDVSAPNGDAEDWLQFTSYDRLVTLKITCSGNGLRVELWNNETRLEDFPLACGSEKLVTVAPNGVYFVRLSAPNSGEFHYVNYIAFIESVQ